MIHAPVNPLASPCTPTEPPIRSERRSAVRTLRFFRDLVLPREHGSWSLALEPLALGLLVAPSLPGILFCYAVVAGFLLRRPLGIAVRDHRIERRVAARVAALGCAGVAVLFFAATLFIAGAGWLRWLLPSVISGAVFLSFDLRNEGRTEIAEVVGASAFAFLPAVTASLAGWGSRDALALGLVMLGRAVPTVLSVRAALRGAKSGEHRPGLALSAAVTACIIGIALARQGLAPWSAAGLLALSMASAIALLVFPRPALRARTIGLSEAAFGVGFVLATALSWPALRGPGLDSDQSAERQQRLSSDHVQTMKTTTPRKSRTIDVRVMIARGEDPFNPIMAAVAALSPAEDLVLVTPFLPSPLIERLRMNGFQARPERMGDGGWRTQFERATTVSP